MKLKNQQIFKVAQLKVQLKSKCENEAKKQVAVCDTTHKILNYIVREKYVQKDLENEKYRLRK